MYLLVADVRKQTSRLWIGEHSCLTLDNIRELKVTHVICLMDSEEKASVPVGLEWGKPSGGMKEIKNSAEEDSKEQTESIR